MYRDPSLFFSKWSGGLILRNAKQDSYNYEGKTEIEGFQERFISYGGLYVGKDIGSNGEKLANYLYLCKAPVIDNPLIFTREWPVYMPIILFIGLLHILILYYFF